MAGKVVGLPSVWVVPRLRVARAAEKRMIQHQERRESRCRSSRLRNLASRGRTCGKESERRRAASGGTAMADRSSACVLYFSGE